MNTLTITGHAAELKWAYHSAAALASWSISADAAGGGTLTATVISMDTFKASQQPLTFRVPRPNGSAWCWPVQSLQIAGQTLTASLGPQE